MRMVQLIWLAFGLIAAASVEAHTIRLHDRFATSAELEFVSESGAPTSRFPMTKVAFGIWEAEPEWDNTNVTYRFILDDKLPVSDIGNPAFVRLDDGSIWSRFTATEPASHTEPKEVLHPITFGFTNQAAQSVMIAGEFNHWSQEPLRRIRDGEWRITLHLPQGDYGYKLVVDGVWLTDPANDQRILNDGVENSLVRVNAERADPPPSPQDNAASRDSGGHPVTFSLYAPTASRVAVVGTFNDWNESRGRMEQSGESWTFSTTLSAGTHEYKFKADDHWLTDPNNPMLSGGVSSGNSVLEIAQPRTLVALDGPLIDPEAWRTTDPILLEQGSSLHPFQQELLRAWLVVQATDGHGLAVADGTLIQSGPPLLNPAGRWEWRVGMEQARLVITMTVTGRCMTLPLAHPVLASPHEWLAALRRDGNRLIPDGMVLNGPTSPPPDSAWAIARKAKSGKRPMADVFSINQMTAFGRTQGWSRPLLQDLATAYADLSQDHRYPAMGGWAPSVFAARAVVYAELGRGSEPRDKTMAYVLARIGRPRDAAELLPEDAAGFRGKLADILIHQRRDDVMAQTGTPDHYGFELAAGLESVPPAMNHLTRWQQAMMLRTLSELLEADEQTSLARMYLQASINLLPDDAVGHRLALMKGSVSAGHRHAATLLGLAGDARLWETALEGVLPILTDQPPGPAKRSRGRTASEKDIGSISRIYKNAFRTPMDFTTEAIPAPARLVLLRDQLNDAWWLNARFHGRHLYSRSGCEQLNRLMSPWKPLHPEMEAFTRFLMRRPLEEHPYKAIREGLEQNSRRADTLAFVSLVRKSFVTWLLDSAQELYPHTSRLQSDLVPDYIDEEDIHVFLSMDHLRSNIRRLSPADSRGYPGPGELPTPTDAKSLPDTLARSSFGINKRLAEAWNHRPEPEALEHARRFYERCLEISPYETSIYRSLSGILMDNGHFEDILSMAQTFPDTLEGLDATSMQRLGALAALELGHMEDARQMAERAAASWQGGAMLTHAYVMETAGEWEKSAAIVLAQDQRYDGNDHLYFLARTNPEEAKAKAAPLFAWLEQFSDLKTANDQNQFSFNEFKERTFEYAALGQWEKALWLLKPLAEAVQNDFIWFLLMTAGQKNGDQAAENLAEHVLANHVQNAFGEVARFNRGSRTWSQVVHAARVDGKNQPVFLFAALLAEERGDVNLAKRLLLHAQDPRQGVTGWFTIAWNEYRRLGGDPIAHARRTIPSGQQP
ncbi:MAG TPA: glycogen-binding domain-containing protein [Kiritimatiellia bacterium]|nr:glycogen-binding domain-containing protein [Kiritimatiellia bacterium]HMP34031.1 glycogen-binding domain-containing protein [Kiritimatiellia bacterium]